jgi:hypothetical protein
MPGRQGQKPAERSPPTSATVCDPNPGRCPTGSIPPTAPRRARRCGRSWPRFTSFRRVGGTWPRPGWGGRGGFGGWFLVALAPRRSRGKRPKSGTAPGRPHPPCSPSSPRPPRERRCPASPDSAAPMAGRRLGPACRAVEAGRPSAIGWEPARSQAPGGLHRNYDPVGGCKPSPGCASLPARALSSAPRSLPPLPVAGFAPKPGPRLRRRPLWFERCSSPGSSASSR